MRTVNVIRKRIVDRDVIELRGRLIVLRGPGFPAVNRDTGAAVIRVADTIRILRIDPKTVMISVTRREQVKCLAAINRFEGAGV